MSLAEAGTQREQKRSIWSSKEEVFNFVEERHVRGLTFLQARSALMAERRAQMVSARVMHSRSPKPMGIPLPQTTPALMRGILEEQLG